MVLPAIKEGRRFLACPDCIKAKGLIPISSRPVPIAVPRTRPSISKRQPKGTTALPEPLQLVEDFGNVVRRAREKMGLTQAELAARIAEKLSVIKKIEAGKLKPDEALLHKLERALKIKLTEEGA